MSTNKLSGPGANGWGDLSAYVKGSKTHPDVLNLDNPPEGTIAAQLKRKRDYFDEPNREKPIEWYQINALLQSLAEEKDRVLGRKADPRIGRYLSGCLGKGVTDLVIRRAFEEILSLGRK
ncbi:MAG: hypothetical protein PHZ00_02730 [Candidatus Peribacteraceae bacterium]|nr:hypothetical protein [Candidatus Peribacteraceae bacterium]